MVDPANITNYNLSVPELEEVLLFWVLASGKNGTVAAKQLEDLIEDWELYSEGPFDIFRAPHIPKPIILATIAKYLRSFGVGCYSHKARTIFELVESSLDLRTCTAEDLEQIYGIGMKTSRCFIIHSRKDAEHAGLDTHALKFLASKGHDVPKSTPTSRKKYLELEQLFLTYVKESGKTVAQFDLDIWNYYKVKVKTN